MEYFTVVFILFFASWSMKEVNSLTNRQVRPNFIRLEVPNHLEAGADLLRLNGSAQSFRYLIANQNLYTRKFFLANGQTLTTLEQVDLPSEANISLAVLEEGSDVTRVIPIEILVASHQKEVIR